MEFRLTVSIHHFLFTCRKENTQVPFDISDCKLDQETCKLVFSNELRKEGYKFRKLVRKKWWEKIVPFLGNTVYVIVHEEVEDDLLIRSIDDYATSILTGTKTYFLRKSEFEKSGTNATNLKQYKHVADFNHLVSKYQKTKEERFLIESDKFPVKELYNE